MNNFGLKYIVTVLILLFLACKDEKETVTLEGKEYFPLRKGQTQIYQCDSVIYNDFTGTINNVSYISREKTLDSFVDQAGKIVYRVQVERELTTNVWTDFYMYAKWQTVNTIESMENNDRVINIALPINYQHTWNGNLYNSKGQAEFFYDSIAMSRVVNTSTFNNTITVFQSKEIHPIFAKVHKEIYAKDIGLIYKEVIDTNVFQGRSRKAGYIFTKKLLENY